MNPWQITEVMKIMPKFEEYAFMHGWHIAIGGGVMKRGYSYKDLDIIVYPHSSQDGGQLLPFIEDLKKQNVTDWVKLDRAKMRTDTYTGNFEYLEAEEYSNPRDEKLIYTSKYSVTGQRIDWLFPTESTYLKTDNFVVGPALCRNIEI